MIRAGVHAPLREQRATSSPDPRITMLHRLPHCWTLVFALACLGCGDNAATPEPVAQRPAPVQDAASTPASTMVVAQPERADLSTDEAATNPTVATAAAADHPDAVVAAFETLSSLTASPGEWEQAQQTIIEHGAGALPVLVEALRSKDGFRRETSSSLLAMLGPDAAPAEDALIAALNDESVYVRANAATALCTLPGHDEAAIAVFIELLASDEPHLRQMAAMNLANYGTAAAPFADRIAAAVKDAPPDVSQPVIQLLQQLSESGAEKSAVQAEFVEGVERRSP